MLSKRVVAISADKGFSKRMAAGLQAAGGMVESVGTPDELAKGEISADLVVVHVTEGAGGVIKAVAGRMKKDIPLIAILPTSSLAGVVKAMQDGPVAAVLVADEMEPVQLSAVAHRLLFGDVFGLEKLVPWGVRIYSTLVGDYQEKSVGISAVSDFAASMGVRRKYRESIEQCLDELLMNALYDAPVDTSGRQMFAEIPTKTRISLRMEQKAVVQYACDGNTFAFSVRDSYGMLQPDTVVKYLDKCLHSEQQIDRKTGGAGLGLYIVTNAASQFFLNSQPGVATEAVCAFDLNAPKVQIKSFGIFKERIDSSGRLVGGPSKLVSAGHPRAADLRPAASRGVIAALSAAIVLLLVLIGIVGYPRIVGKPRSSIAVNTTPPGAVLELDGRAVGSTSSGPLTIDELEVGQKFKLTARLDGYEPLDEIVSPIKGTTAPVNLTLVPKAAVVTFETDPPGAVVEVGGKELGVTPLTVTTFEANTDQQVTLKRVGYATVNRNLRVPPPGQKVTESVTLVISSDFGSVRVESEPPGAQLVQNGELIAGVVTPVPDHLVQADRTYTFTLRLPGYMPESRTLKVLRGQRGLPLTVTLKPGGGLSVYSNLDTGNVTVEKVPACKDKAMPMLDCPLANGRYRVKVTSGRPWAYEVFDVKVNNQMEEKRLSFGFVEAGDADTDLQVAGSPRGLRKIALLEGPHMVTVTNNKTSETAQKPVRIVGGRTIPLTFGN